MTRFPRSLVEELMLMRPSPLLVALAGALLLPACLPVRSRADEIAPEYRTAVDKGLEWMAKNQNRDGHWEAPGGQYPVTMTALGGMVFLMEGSTIREGKYADR